MMEQNKDSELEKKSLEERLAKWRQVKSQEGVERSSYFVFGYIANMGVASVAQVAVGLNEDVSLVSDLLLSLEQKSLIQDVTSSFTRQRPQQIAEKDRDARIYQVTGEYLPMKKYGVVQENLSLWNVFRMYFKDLFRRRKQVAESNS